MLHKRVVVVGTTADYIDIIRRRFPQRAVFVTDPAIRAGAKEPPPADGEELPCDLAQPKAAVAALQAHLDQWHVQPSGVVCYDCESMSLAAHMAEVFSLPYPSLHAIATCRDKFRSKRLWREAGVACPDVELIRTLPEGVAFLERSGRPAVLKPLTGSGSEFVFLCHDKYEFLGAFRRISTGLAAHPNIRMYSRDESNGDTADPRHVFAIEEYIRGREYSCDLILDGDRLEIIRIAKKIPAPDSPLGTILAYAVPAALPGGFDRDLLHRQLLTAAHALGLTRAICMVDFIIAKDRAYLLELTPRPGGDCLPDLIHFSSGLDMIGAALDFAEGRPVTIPDPPRWESLVGVRLFASQPGVITAIDTDKLRADPRVLQCYLKRSPGHEVILPPDDYDSRLIGHVIFRPDPTPAIESQCKIIAAGLRLEMKAPSWMTPTVS
jgi:biotin carboxylase